MATTRGVKNALKPALASLLSPSASQQLADAARPHTLYNTLARLPRDGVGARVFQTRWQSKGIAGCFWDVTRVRLKMEGTHGRAWGRLTWRGKPVSARDEEIRGGLKYKWSEGISTGAMQAAVQPIASAPPLPSTDVANPQPEKAVRVSARKAGERRVQKLQDKWHRALQAIKA